MSIGKNIYNLRKKIGFTQKQLAEKVGVNEVTIRSYEAEKYNPKINILTNLCVALDCKITDLIDDDSKKYYRMFDRTEGDTVYADSSIVEYNRIMDKQKNGDGFTPYDIKFVSDYIKGNAIIRELFVVNGLKSNETNLHLIQNAYEHLNSEGQKEAAKRIVELTEIERYTKPDKWFKGNMTKERIEKGIKAYLNDDGSDEPPIE